jgi:hypothetical protein
MMLDTHVRVVVVVGCGALLVLAIARRRTMLAQNRVLPRLLKITPIPPQATRGGPRAFMRFSKTPLDPRILLEKKIRRRRGRSLPRRRSPKPLY